MCVFIHLPHTMKQHLLSALLLATPTLAQGTGPKINEIRVDQPGTDIDEYFELSGIPGSSLAGYTYIVIGDGSGGTGQIENVTDLSAESIPASGYFVCAESSFTLGTADLTASLNFENSDTYTHLVVFEFTGANGDDLDTDNDGVLDSTPWTSISDCIAFINPNSSDLPYCTEQISDGSFSPGHISRCADTTGPFVVSAFDTFDGEDTPGASSFCPPPDVVINEARIDQSSSDDDEYFELAGADGTALDGLSYIVIGDGTGGSGVIESVTDLTGSTIPATTYFVCAESTFTVGVADLTASLNFENSDNVTHLLVQNFTGVSGDDLDTDDDGVLDVTPWDLVVDCIAFIETTDGSGDLVYCTEQVGPDGTFVPAHIKRCDDSVGPFDIGDFGFDDDTPGATNACDGTFETYCVSFPNSFAVGGAQMGYTGSASIGANDSVLTVSDCPENYGIFFFGSAEDFQLPFGNGVLCVAQPIERLNPLSFATGNVNSFSLDFTGVGPETAILAGTSAYFQYWFRDGNQGSGQNVSNGLRVDYVN